MKNARFFFLVLFLQLVFVASEAQTKGELATKINNYLSVLEKSNSFSGTIIVAKNGTPIIRKAYGLANLSYQAPNKISTKFNIASIGKMITSMAIMQLKEQGKLSLKDKVGKFIPSFPNQSVRDSVTIEQLLTHSSGMGQFFTPSFFATSKDHLNTLDDFLPFFSESSLYFSAGEKYTYSNSGFLVLGLIIEAISNQTYQEYVKQHIYEPLKMYDTDAYDLDAIIPDMATGYYLPSNGDGNWKSNLYKITKGVSSGGSFSTADDLLKFANGIRDYTLLSKETTDLMTTGKIMGYNNMYGYGFDDRLINNQRIVGHEGGFYGVKGEVQIYWDKGYTVVILSNIANTGFSDLSYYVQTLIVGSETEKRLNAQTRKLIDVIIQDDLEAALEKVEKDEITAISEKIIEIKGKEQLINNNHSKAIEIFKMGIHFFPNSFQANLNLGIAYKNNNQKKLAIKYYEKSLAINPNFDFIRVELEDMRTK